MKASDHNDAHALPLERFITYRLTTLSSTLNRNTERFLKKNYDISIPDWRVLAVLNRYGPVSVRELAGHSHMDKALVSRVVSRLAKAKYITSKPDASDGRLVVLSLSPSGQDLHDAIMPHAQKRQQGLLQSLSEEEREPLYQMLEKLMHYAQTKDSNFGQDE